RSASGTLPHPSRRFAASGVPTDRRWVQFGPRAGHFRTHHGGSWASRRFAATGVPTDRRWVQFGPWAEHFRTHHGGPRRSNGSRDVNGSRTAGGFGGPEVAAGATPVAAAEWWRPSGGDAVAAATGQSEVSAASSARA